jgi:hypothetical protein
MYETIMNSVKYACIDAPQWKRLTDVQMQMQVQVLIQTIHVEFKRACGIPCMVNIRPAFDIIYIMRITN